MTAIAALALRHRRWVFLFWTLMLVAGGALAGRTTSSLTFDFSLPGQPGYVTDLQIADVYGNGGSVPPLIPVVTVPEGTSVRDQQAKVDGVFAAVQDQIPEVRVIDFAMTRDARFLSE